MGFIAVPAPIKCLSLFALLLLLGCTNDNNSFRALDLTATATLDGGPVAVAPKVMVVGDVASPRLADLLEVRGYEVTNVPYVSYEASAQDIDADYIVWTDKRNGNFDVFAYQISTAKEFPVSLAAGNQVKPQISGDYVVWEDYRNGNADIYAYRFSTATEIAVTTAGRNQLSPQIDGDYIVWQDERNNESDIYAYQISTGNEVVVSAQPLDGDQKRPQIKADNIVWESSIGGGSTDIKAYDLASRAEFIVNSTSLVSGSRYGPVLSEKYLVWIDNSNGYDTLYAFNLITRDTPFQVSVTTSTQLRPQLSGGYVVWQDFRNGVDYDIYAYNLDSNNHIDIPVSVRDKAQLFPQIDGDYITWQDFRDDNYDIYAYRISTAEEIAISPHVTPQTRPLMANGQITWLDGRRGLVDVVFRPAITAVDQLATVEWLTPAGVTETLAEQALVIFGSDVFSDEVVLSVFDAAITAKVNVLGLGGTGTSLAKSLAAAGRYGLSVTPASGVSPMRLAANVSENDIHELFTDVDTSVILALESDEAVSMDELAITDVGDNTIAPLGWDNLASFSTRMANAGKPAIVEFAEESGSKIILDGAASVADKYAYWNSIRWIMFNNEVSYLTK